MNATVLTEAAVETVFLACLFRDGEDTTNHVAAEGIVTNVGFNPERIEEYRPLIEAMLLELPDTFKRSCGGGWSFLEACNDRNGQQWAGLHQRMEQLVQLGVAIGKVQYLLPREAWSLLPGSMPYFVVDD